MTLAQTILQEHQLDRRLRQLRSTSRLERFVMRYIDPAEKELAREKLRKFNPLATLLTAAIVEMNKKGIDYEYPVDTEDKVCDVIRHAVAVGAFDSNPAKWPREVYLALYPRCCGQIISASIGYAMPVVAAAILQNGTWGSDRLAICEWTGTYKGGDREVVRLVLKDVMRKKERILSSYCCLRRGEQAVVKQMMGIEFQFASWF